MSFHTDYDNASPIRACTRKKAYPTEAIAKSAIRSIRLTSPDAEVRPYACRNCGSWHVGGSPGSVKGATDLDPMRPRRSKKTRRVAYGPDREIFKINKHLLDDDDGEY